MFSYLHCYFPETWKAQLDAGLINRFGGIRFPQSIDLEPFRKFNVSAGTDSALYAYVRETRCPFYIDRLQGGCYIEDYPYDMELIRAYRDLLGENFWGFQMHEWMSNFKSDLGKLSANHCPAWTEKDITETILRAFPFPHVFLEAMNAREFAENGCPGDAGTFLADAARLFAKRQRYTDGSLIPCDSAFLAYHLEFENDVQRIMPEIGAQTRDTRVQVAYARGMAKAYGKTFGTYYEPWGGDPFSACCYHTEGLNEWNIGNEDFPFKTCGGNGGSSRSLQRRLHLYSYMAGASFMAEEWGMCNTFYDWHDFALTPYGEVKRDFIRFTEKYPDIGSLLTPAAVVLPGELPVLENIHTDDDLLVGFPVTGSTAAMLKKVRQGVRRIFADSHPMVGVETGSLRNCIVPDAVDLVHEDRFDADAYDLLVDLTPEGTIGRRWPQKAVSAEELPARLGTILPCKVMGNCLSLISRTDNGTYYLMLLNNSGVRRSVAGGESTMPEAVSAVTVSCRQNRMLIPLEGDSTFARTENGDFSVTIPAGGWFFGTF